MCESTTQLLKQLQETAWFTDIGRPLADPEIVHVTKWMDAIASVSDAWWEMLGYQQALALREAVAGADPESDARWDKLDEELSAEVRPLVARQVAPIRAERGFPIVAEMILGHQVRHALLETELLHLPEPGFFVQIASWLLRGRFPCGGDDAGKLCIY